MFPRIFDPQHVEVIMRGSRRVHNSFVILRFLSPALVHTTCGVTENKHNSTRQGLHSQGVLSIGTTLIVYGILSNTHSVVYRSVRSLRLLKTPSGRKESLFRPRYLFEEKEALCTEGCHNVIIWKRKLQQD